MSAGSFLGLPLQRFAGRLHYHTQEPSLSNWHPEGATRRSRTLSCKS